MSSYINRKFGHRGLDKNHCSEYDNYHKEKSCDDCDNYDCNKGCETKVKHHKEKSHKCHDSVKDDCWKQQPEYKCECKCECVKDVLCVEKNLLTVARVPLAGFVEALAEGTLPANTPFAQLVLTYEIVLVNKSEKEICNLSVFDSLAGVVFADSRSGTVPFDSTVIAISSCDSLTPFTRNEIVNRRGQLIDSANSYLPPCSTSRIILTLAMTAPENSICEIRYVQNTVSVEGRVYDCNKYKRIEPVMDKSAIWETDSDVTLLLGFTVTF